MTARFTTRRGHSRHYVATDHLETPQLQVLGHAGVLARAARQDLRFDHKHGRGVVFHMLSSIEPLATVGVTAIADSSESCGRPLRPRPRRPGQLGRQARAPRAPTHASGPRHARLTRSNSLASHRTKRPAIRNATSIANVPVSFAGCAEPHIRRATASAVWAISSGRSPRRLGPRERGPGLGECFSRGARVRRRHSLTLPRSLCASSARGESGRSLSGTAIVARLARFGGTAPLSLGDNSSAASDPATVASVNRGAGRPLARGPVWRV